MAAKSLAFHADQNGQIRFDTGVIRGRLQSENLTFGIHELVDCATGQPLCGRFGLFNVYRVFSDGKRYGSAGWDWPGQATVNQDGSVTVVCPATADRPFSLSGQYRLSQPAVVDLEIRVTPQTDLHGFEVFLASYFDSAYTQSLVYVSQQTAPTFLRATQSLGHWLTFPRDAKAVSIVQDGRWKLPPNPVDWTIQSQFEQPLAAKRPAGPGPTALLMAPKKSCFAISMPYETEAHYSVYLSLFGRDVAVQDTAVCHARLQFINSPSDQVMINAQQAIPQ